MKLTLVIVLVLSTVCIAQDDGDGSGEEAPGDSTWTGYQWLQYKMEVATGAETGAVSVESTSDESVEDAASESASEGASCLDDPNYCPTEYEGSAMPGTVEMLDVTGSDESLRDQASSGFDKPGAIVVEESPAVYQDEDGVTILIPVDSPPEEVNEGEEE